MASSAPMDSVSVKWQILARTAALVQKSMGRLSVNVQTVSDTSTSYN